MSRRLKLDLEKTSDEFDEEYRVVNFGTRSPEHVFLCVDGLRALLRRSPRRKMPGRLTLELYDQPVRGAVPFFLKGDTVTIGGDTEFDGVKYGRTQSCRGQYEILPCTFRWIAARAPIEDWQKTIEAGGTVKLWIKWSNPDGKRN